MSLNFSLGNLPNRLNWVRRSCGSTCNALGHRCSVGKYGVTQSEGRHLLQRILQPHQSTVMVSILKSPPDVFLSFTTSYLSFLIHVIILMSCVFPYHSASLAKHVYTFASSVLCLHDVNILLYLFLNRAQ